MDVSKLSDDGLLRLIASLSSRPEPQQTPGQMAAEGVGPIQAGFIGAGKGLDDVWQGAKQLYYRATGDQQSTDALAAQQAEANRNYGPLKEQRPLMTSIGESFPSMASMALSGGSSALPIALGKAALASGVAEGAKYGTDQERVTKGLTGAAEGAGGTMLGYGLGRLITPRGVGGNAPSQEALQAAERLGVTLTPGQRTGDIPMRKLEQMLAQRTGSAGQFSDLQAANQAAINRGAAQSIGEAADAITPDVLASARARIGGQFQQLTKNVDVKLGNDFLDALASVETQNATLPASLRSPKVSAILDDVLDLATKGKISGEQYQATRSALTRAASDAFAGNNSALGQSLKNIAGALDDAAGQSLTKTEQAAWQQARKEWKSLRILESGNVVQDGNVSAQLLKGQVKKADPVLYREGKTSGPLTDIARYAEGVRPLQDSGTPGGIAAMNMANPAGLIQSLTGGTPFRWAVAKGMLSQPGSAYLSNGVLSDEARRLLMQGGGLLGAGVGGGQ